MNVEIQFAEPLDIPSWMALVEQVQAKFPGLETVEALEEYRQTVLRFMGRQCAICAKQAGEVVGVLLISRKRNQICCMAVHPAWRRQHIASAMMRLALEQLDARRAITVTTYREGTPEGVAARAFYQHMGFMPDALGEEYGAPVQLFVRQAQQAESKEEASI